MVKDMLNKAFAGSKYDLVVRTLGEKTSANEIAEIRQLLDNLEQSNK